MHVKKYSARNIHEALRLVRQELGPDATVLQTREVTPKGIFRFLPTATRIEVTATDQSNVPSRFTSHNCRPRTRKPASSRNSPQPTLEKIPAAESSLPPAQSVETVDPEVRNELLGLQQLVHDLRDAAARKVDNEVPDAVFSTFTDLIEADVAEEVARELIETAQHNLNGDRLSDRQCIADCIYRTIESQICTTSGIQLPAGPRRLVALVGPTGVGKTTTIAKLAANYRLREKRNVGLITVDTYRIAAVDQLQTYADIIDLPLEVVSTPREMRAAIDRLQDQELILMDTAGRSPRDEVKVQELKSMLAEADADEVHLVLSSVAGGSQLLRAAQQFSSVGTTSLILTKLDEATSFGHLLSLLRQADLPISYVTDGQNVPDDIRIAKSEMLARIILGKPVDAHV